MQCLRVQSAEDLTDDTAATAINLETRADSFRANHTCLVAFASLDAADTASVLEGSDDEGSTWEPIAFADPNGGMLQFKECVLKGRIRSKPAPATLTADLDGLALDQQPNIAADTDGLSAAANPAADTALTLLSGHEDLDPVRQVSITSSADASGVSFTVYGIDKDGNRNSETITGPNNTTVTGSIYWQSIDEIIPDASLGSDVEAGWPATYEPMTLESGVDDLTSIRQVSLESTGDFSGVNFTVRGTDLVGNEIEEVIAGPDNSTVTTTKFFAGVTAIIPDPTDTVVGTNISAGWIAQTAAGTGSIALLGN